MSRRTRTVLVLSCALGLLLTGCSSGKSDTSAPPAADTSSAPDAGSSAGAGSESAAASAPASESAGGAASSAGSSTAGGSSAGGSGEGKTGPLKLVEIDKQGTQQYFVDQATGAKNAAQKAGDVSITVTDVQLDANAAINAINTAIAQKADGILITVPDQKIGPQVIQLAQQAGIPVVATNDPMQDSSGKPAPFVGFNSEKMGESVGQKAGELFKASGWAAADTRVVNIEKQDLSDCVDRGKGALSAFTKVVGSDLPKVIDVSTDAATPQAIDKVGAIVTANPGVKYWVVWGCNDESETGGVTALQNAGFAGDTVIGVGLGAYLTCKDWKAGADTGNKAALFIDGKDVGATAVDIMVEHLRTGKPLPAETLAPTKIVDATSWKEAGVECT